MGILKKLLSRFWPIGILLILGVCLIIYIGLGILYLQQTPKQKDLEERTNSAFLVASKPLPSMAELQAKYDEVNLALSPLSVPESLEVIVKIARKSGIDVDPLSGRFSVPPPAGPEEKKMGEGTYQVLSINRIQAQGDYEEVLAFISDLNSGETLKTMVLKKVEMSQVEIRFGKEETARRLEFHEVLAAVKNMMADNNITELLDSIYFDGGTASNDMSAFPDSTATAAEKGYTGTGTPSAGYVLYQHHKIPTDNTTQFETVDYTTTEITQYYYTCEVDGMVRQFDGPDLSTATEYFGSEEVKIETVLIMDVDLYTKPARK